MLNANHLPQLLSPQLIVAIPDSTMAVCCFEPTGWFIVGPVLGGAFHHNYDPHSCNDPGPHPGCSEFAPPCFACLRDERDMLAMLTLFGETPEPYCELGSRNV